MSASISITLHFIDGLPISSRAECRIRAAPATGFQSLTLQQGAFTGTIAVPTDPNGSASFVVSIHGQGFWDREEGFSIAFVAGRPLLLAGSAWSRQSVTGTLDANLAISLDLVVLRLKDITDQIVPKIADSFEVFDFDPDILGPYAAGTATTPLPPFLNPQTVSLDNRSLRFFQWIAGNSTIGVYVPTSAKPIDGTYLFFFKPPKHAGFDVKSVAEIYLTDADMTDHQILANCELAQSDAVLCFLFGESGNPEVMANAAVISDVIAEIDLVLCQNEWNLGGGVKSVALASFSEGGRLMNNVLSGLAGSRLNGVLSGIFVFDSWFGDGQLEVFRSRIRAWFAGGADGNVLRVYQGETVTDPDILVGQRAPQTNGPDGTVQKVVGDANSPDYFYLKITDAFLRHNAPRLVPPNDLHHAVPKLFLVHAIKTTQF